MVIGGAALLPVVGPAVLGFSAYRSWVRHSPILPRAYGTRHRLPRVAPPGKSAGDLRGFVAWHGMDWVMASIAGRRSALGCR